MKKITGGLLIAATMLSPITPAIAQSQGDRGNRTHQGAQGARDNDQRRSEVRRDVQRDRSQTAPRQREVRQREVRQREAPQRTQQRDQRQRPVANSRDQNRNSHIRANQDRRSQDQRRQVERQRQHQVERQRDRDRRNDHQRWNNRQAQSGNWNRNWRNDNRYNYRDYRSRNRQAYRMPRYQAPYNNHRYNRFSIGVSLGSSFYNQRYWISNPGYYRLPAAYGNYRWVRYYDDALLIDVRRGRVVDVLYDFFW